MRILHMIPDIGISNGVMSVILNYAKAMPDDVKFDVVYFSQKDKTRQPEIEALGGKAYKVDTPSPKDLLTGKMNGFFDKHKNEWSALHIHCPHFAVFIAPNAKKAGIEKIFVHCHTTEFSLKGNSKRNQLLSLYSKYFIKDKFACSSESGKLWYGNRKFTVLNNAIDTKLYAFDRETRDRVRRDFNFESGLVVAHIGRTDIEQKNHPFILKIFSNIIKLKPSSKLMLIGAEYTAELKKLCDELDITDSVLFMGVRNDVPELLSAADVFLFPSISEGLPVSVIEAQAAGLLVLMSDSITSEVAVTDSVNTLSLNDDAVIWSKKCMELASLKRASNTAALKNNGWDIELCAERLLNFYRR